MQRNTRLGIRFVGLPNPNASCNRSASLKDRWANLLKQVLGHVLGRRIVRQNEQATGRDDLQGCNRVVVVLADQKTVIPVLVNPPLAAGLEVRKVDHSTNGILGLASDKEITNVVVPVEILALATMAVQAVTGAKLDASHDRQVHKNAFPLFVGEFIGEKNSGTLEFRVFSMTIDVPLSLFQ